MFVIDRNYLFLEITKIKCAGNRFISKVIGLCMYIVKCCILFFLFMVVLGGGARHICDDCVDS